MREENEDNGLQISLQILFKKWITYTQKLSSWLQIIFVERKGWFKKVESFSQGHKIQVKLNTSQQPDWRRLLALNFFGFKKSSELAQISKERNLKYHNNLVRKLDQTRKPGKTLLCLCSSLHKYLKNVLHIKLKKQYLKHKKIAFQKEKLQE